MLNMVSQWLRLRYRLRVVRSPTSWTSLVFLLVTWLIRRRRLRRYAHGINQEPWSGDTSQVVYSMFASKHAAAMPDV